jgi:signal transduction histidine kinase
VRVDETAPGELAELGAAFNAMAADLQRTLDELQSERDRVAGLLEARRQLVAGVSHELRPPVATVKAYVESALRRDGAVDSQVRADLETMDRELDRLQRLIDDLFTLSRAEVGRLDLRIEAVDIAGVARRLVETSAPLAWRQRQVQVLTEVAPDVPLACADLQRTEQIISNLLSNAVRHTPPGGLVATVVRAEQDRVVLEVSDTGEGIDPDALPRVFERFYRADHGDANGAGLGLALVKELAEAMGGTVEAASERGKGSTFTVRLPIAAAAAAPARL